VSNPFSIFVHVRRVGMPFEIPEMVLLHAVFVMRRSRGTAQGREEERVLLRHGAERHARGAAALRRTRQENRKRDDYEDREDSQILLHLLLRCVKTLVGDFAQ
jgi:hypothetical protein